MTTRPVDILFPGMKKPKDEGRCPTCTQPITEFRDALSRKEFTISGMCQDCQDEIWGGTKS